MIRFVQTTDGYYLNLAHVICARPRTPNSDVIIVQLSTQSVIGWIDEKSNPSFWQRHYFEVTRAEWTRVANTW